MPFQTSNMGSMTLESLSLEQTRSCHAAVIVRRGQEEFVVDFAALRTNIDWRRLSAHL